ncbi:MAG: VWA domain-containing protein [Acidimicrobiia bacterium]|nr:MAG: VWA domain-containing protein [Acidimicrobiia bacterium]
MITRLTAFAGELRDIGIPVSLVEMIDAAEALQHADLSSPEALRAALGATMVKQARHRPAFDAAFDVFFGYSSPAEGDPAELDDETLRARIAEALLNGDTDELQRLLSDAVDRYAGVDPGRPLGGRYHQYRVLRRLDADQLRRTLLAALLPAQDGLDDRLRIAEADRMVEIVRDEVRSQVLRRLIAERGAPDVARSIRTPLVENIDLQHGTRDEIEAVEKAVAPLARRLATRLSQRRRHGRRGRLDVRRTIRRSLAHGGAMLDPRFRPPRVGKPEIVLLCDVSGSMATFARFTLQLTHAIGGELANVRSFAFIDGIDEVTPLFGPGADFEASMTAMASEADLVRGDGHSDYGLVFEEFAERFASVITPRTTLIVTGDARSNFRDSGADTFSVIAEPARAVLWLNPERRRYWNTGDSVMSAYAGMCDEVEEVRTLAQLERFVERVALPTGAGRRVGRSTSLDQPIGPGSRWRG